MVSPGKRSEPKQANTPAGPSTRGLVRFLVPGLVVLVTVVAFLPVLLNDFVNWDDDQNLLGNLNYRGLGWAQARWMFTTFHLSNYRPLTWVTLGLDYLLWGMNPFGYHLTSLLLHAVNAAIFYFVTLRLLGLTRLGPSAPKELALQVAAVFSALIFALHPLRVEPVAWASARNDVLSGLFFLWTILCYVRANAIPEGDRMRMRWKTAAVVLYGMSLLSKAIGMTLPVVLLVLDIYPLKRLGGGPGKWFGSVARRVWWEKAPFVIVAVGSGVIALFAKEEFGLVLPFAQYGPMHRIAVAFYGLTFYLRKTILPVGLSPYYPLPIPFNPWDWPFLLSGVVVLVVSIGLFVARHRWPSGLAIWVCYLSILAPVLGIVQIGRQMVADRYSYLSCLPLATLVGGGAIYLWRTWMSGRIGQGASVLTGGLAVTVLVGLGTLTWKQTQVWHDSEKLWRQALSISPSAIAYNNLGVALLRQKRLDEATEQLRKALEINPSYVDALYNVGLVLAELGDSKEAIKYFRRVLELRPEDVRAHKDLAITLAGRGQLGEAIQHLRRALEINPAEAVIHHHLATILASRGDLSEAIEHFRRVLEIKPGDAKVHSNLAIALASTRDIEGAIVHLQRALEIQPDFPEAHHWLGIMMAAKGQLDKAVDQFRSALRVRPEFAEAHESLGRALAELGNRDEAIRHYQEALRIMRSRGDARSAR